MDDFMLLLPLRSGFQLHWVCEVSASTFILPQISQARGCMAANSKLIKERQEDLPVRGKVIKRKAHLPR